MTKKGLLAFIEQTQSNLIKDFAKLGKKFTHKKIRLLRVWLKQHKTFRAFINFAWEKNGSIETFEPLSIDKTVKKLYKKSGKTRKWYVCKKKSAKYLDSDAKKQLKSFQKYCKHKSKKQRKKFYKVYTVVDKENTYKELFSEIYNYFTNNTLVSHKKNYKAYKNTLIQTIQTMLENKPIDIDTIHEIRKEIKHLLYFAQLFDDPDASTWKYFSKLIWRTNDKDDLIIALNKYQSHKKTSKKWVLWSESAIQNLENQLQNDSKTIIHELEDVFLRS